MKFWNIPKVAEYFGKAVTPHLYPISQLHKQIVAKFAPKAYWSSLIKSIIKFQHV